MPQMPEPYVARTRGELSWEEASSILEGRRIFLELEVCLRGDGTVFSVVWALPSDAVPCHAALLASTPLATLPR